MSANAGRLNRITIELGKCGGRPCIRGHRIRVRDVLQLLASGASFEEVLADYPFLEREDLYASLEYAGHQSGHSSTAEDNLSILSRLMATTESPKEKLVFKYAISLLEILHGKRATTWSLEDYKRLPDSLAWDGEHLRPMKQQGKGFVRWG